MNTTNRLLLAAAAGLIAFASLPPEPAQEPAPKPTLHAPGPDSPAASAADGPGAAVAAQEEPPAEPPAPPTPPTPSDGGGIDEGIAPASVWFDDADTALSIARETGRLAIVVDTPDWFACEPCERLKLALTPYLAGTGGERWVAAYRDRSEAWCKDHGFDALPVVHLVDPSPDPSADDGVVRPRAIKQLVTPPPKTVLKYLENLR